MYFTLSIKICCFFPSRLSGGLENIDDYAVDIPKIWEYMGDILEPMVEDKLPLSFLKDVLEPYIPSETAGKLIWAVLHCAAKEKVRAFSFFLRILVFQITNKVLKSL